MDVRKYISKLGTDNGRILPTEHSSQRVFIARTLESDWARTDAGRASFENMLTRMANEIIVDFPNLQERLIQDCWMHEQVDTITKQVTFTCVLELQDAQ